MSYSIEQNLIACQTSRSQFSVGDRVIITSLLPAKLSQYTGMITSKKTQLDIMLDEIEENVKNESILWRVDLDLNDTSYKRRISALETLATKGPDATVLYPLLENLEQGKSIDTCLCPPLYKNMEASGRSALTSTNVFRLGKRINVFQKSTQ